MVRQADRTRQPIIRPSFVISGEGWTPDECSRLIGIAPDETGTRGERPAGKGMPFLDTRWEVRVEQRGHYIDGPVRALLDRVWDRRSEIEAFLDQTGASTYVYCAVSLFGEPAGYSLSAESIRRLAALRAEFSLDIVDYSES